jgi:hypothetical protein
LHVCTILCACHRKTSSLGRVSWSLWAIESVPTKLSVVEISDLKSDAVAIPNRAKNEWFATDGLPRAADSNIKVQRRFPEGRGEVKYVLNGLDSGDQSFRRVETRRINKAMKIDTQAAHELPLFRVKLRWI